MEENEEEERDAKRNANNVTTDTFIQSPRHDQYTKKENRRSKWEANFFGQSDRNDKRI